MVARYGGHRLVQPGRPRPRHPPLPHPAAGRGRHPSEVTAEIAAAWGLGLAPAPGHRRPARDPRDGGRPRRRAARSASRSGSCSAATPCPSGPCASSAATPPAPRPACWRPWPRPTRSSSPRRTRSCRSGRCWPCPRSMPRVRARRDDTVAVSPIVAGAALKGPADRLMVDLGHESSVVGVARLYRDVASVLVVDDADAASAPAVEAEGMSCVATPTVMSAPEVATALARTVLAAVGVDREPRDQITPPSRGLRRRRACRDRPGRRPGRPDRHRGRGRRATSCATATSSS